VSTSEDFRGVQNAFTILRYDASTDLDIAHIGQHAIDSAVLYKLLLQQRRKAMSRNTLLKSRSAWLLTAVFCSFISTGAVSQEESLQTQVDNLRKQVDELNTLAVRTQSHIMMDVEYQFSNLWFAARNEQWDLAAFYLRETKSHLDWTVRVRPVRNVAGGGKVELVPFQQSIEQGGFARLATALEKKDVKAFNTAYRETLPQCHSCHQAAGLGYLEPHIPERAPSTLMIKGE
jgi:hypothetical protein